LGGQLPVLRLDLHERLPLEPLKGRVEEILDLEIIPEVDIDVQAAQVSLSGHMTIRGTYLAETLTEYEWEQEPSTEEVRAEHTSEPFPFEYRIPLEIVCPVTGCPIRISCGSACRKWILTWRHPTSWNCWRNWW